MGLWTCILSRPRGETNSVSDTCTPPIPACPAERTAGETEMMDIIPHPTPRQEGISLITKGASCKLGATPESLSMDFTSFTTDYMRQEPTLISLNQAYIHPNHWGGRAGLPRMICRNRYTHFQQPIFQATLSPAMPGQEMPKFPLYPV